MGDNSIQTFDAKQLQLLSDVLSDEQNKSHHKCESNNVKLEVERNESHANDSADDVNEKYDHCRENSADNNNNNNSKDELRFQFLSQLMAEKTEAVHRCPSAACLASFRTIQLLQSHRRAQHSDERPFKCDKCGRSFVVIHDMKTHTKKVHGEHAYACDRFGCAFSTTTKYALRLHQERHAVERLSFRCDWIGCNEAYTRNSSLRRHKAKHFNVGASLYRCQFADCDYQTDRPDSLTKHTVVHTSERKFACSWPSCEKRLKSERILREHMRVHMNDKRHKCQWPGCDYSCVKSSNLKTHAKIHCKT